MAKAYYSTVFEQNAADWNIIRDFNNYSIWVRGEGESRIEDGKSGETIRRGAKRAVSRSARPAAAIGASRTSSGRRPGSRARRRLPVSDYQSTTSVSRRSWTATGRVVEWSATIARLIAAGGG